MRVFLVSNVAGGTDKFAEAFEKTGSSVVAKETNSDTKALVKSVSEAVKNGYELIIVVPDDAVAAGMYLNKSDTVMAAVCATEKDIESAFNDSANVIILSDPTHVHSKLLERVRTAEKSSAPMTEAKQEAKTKYVKEQKHVKEIPKERRAEEKEREENAEGMVLEKGSRRGIFGKLKDSLGIIDE